MIRFVILILVFLSFNLLFGQDCKFEKYYPYYPDGIGSTRAIELRDGGFLLAVPAMDDTVDYEFWDPTLVLVRTNACGKTLWVNTIGNPGTGDDDLTLHELSDGNILVVGNTPAGLPGALNSIRLAKHNGNTGALIKEEFVKGTPSSVSVGCVPNPYLPGSFIVFGNTNDYPSVGYKSRPLLVEIDESLTVKRWKQFQYTEFVPQALTTGSIGSLFVKDAKTYYTFMDVGWTNTGYKYLVTLDTAFNIINKIEITSDLGSYWLNSDCQPRWDSLKQEFVGYGFGMGGEGLFRIGADGKLKSWKHIARSYDCTPTKDGGYLAATISTTSDDEMLHKLDSDFNTVWMKQTHGQLRTVLETRDGSCVGTGFSYHNFLSTSIAQLYLVRTDPDGTFFYSGVNDEQEITSPIAIYPNPSSGIFTIQGIPPRNLTATVWDATGKVVFKEPLSNPTVDLNTQPQGLYVLHLTDASGKVAAIYRLSVVR